MNPTETYVEPKQVDPLDQTERLKTMYKKIAALPPEDRVIVSKALDRYLAEALKGTYKAEPGALVQLITANKLLESSDLVVDLGAGPGDLLREIASLYPNIPMCGIDISPGFVENFNQSDRPANASMDVGLIDSPLTDADVRSTENASVISVLTLDRMVNPKILIENMARFGKAKILAALLPNVPFDDNPSRQDEGKKIIYTREPNRIVPGKTIAEDRDVLRRVLKDVWKKPVEIDETKYVVSSSGDRQEYDLSVFYTKN